MPPDAQTIKEHARSLGLDLVGIAPARTCSEAAGVLEQRRAAGLQSQFDQGEIAVRCDPQQWLTGARSIIAAAISYLVAGSQQPSPVQAAAGPRGQISRYCNGRDYHPVLRERLGRLAEFIQTAAPGHRCAVMVDTGPAIDRELAVQAGLGFYGKSANLITRHYGTWVFLGAVITTLPLATDPPGQGTCGECTRCLDACPTGAIVAPGVIDANRCVSELTQKKGFIARDLRRGMGRYLFGCDDCQSVCPYNRRVTVRAGDHPEFSPDPNVTAHPLLAQILSMSKAQFQQWFAGSSAGWRGKTVLQRNAVIALGNSGDSRAVELLLDALADARPVLRGHAAWALGQFAGDRRTTQALLAQRDREDDPRVRAEIDWALAVHEGRHTPEA